jgi:hypothetical protein
VRTARVAEGGNKQVDAQLRPADLDQAFAKIDLHLLAGRRLEPHRRSRLRLELLPIRLHRPLDRAQADGDGFLDGQFLAEHIGIAAMTAQPLPQPSLQTVKRLLALRLLVWRPPPAARYSFTVLRLIPNSREIRLLPHPSSLSRSIAETASGSS